MQGPSDDAQPDRPLPLPPLSSPPASLSAHSSSRTPGGQPSQCYPSFPLNLDFWQSNPTATSFRTGVTGLKMGNAVFGFHVLLSKQLLHVERKCTSNVPSHKLPLPKGSQGHSTSSVAAGPNVSQPRLPAALGATEGAGTGVPVEYVQVDRDRFWPSAGEREHTGLRICEVHGLPRSVNQADAPPTRWGPPTKTDPELVTEQNLSTWRFFPPSSLYCDVFTLRG